MLAGQSGLTHLGPTATIGARASLLQGSAGVFCLGDILKAATIIAQATPELPEVTRWEVWGPLGVLLAVGVIAFLSWFFLVFIPGQKERSKREERLGNAQIESLQASSETGVALTRAYQQLVPLVTEIKQDHAEHRQEVGNLFSGVRKDIGQLHGRIDRLYERRSDGSIDCVKDD